MSDEGKSVSPTYRWVILAVTMLAGFIGSFAQFQLPPLAYKLIPNLHISSSQFAALVGGTMTGSIFICILGGTLADRYGVKKVVSIGLALAVIGCTFRYAATSFWPFFFLMVMAGLGSGLLASNLAKLFGAWFSPQQMGTIMGIFLVSPMFGQFAGTATTALFSSEASAFIFSGVCCFIILILWLVFAKNKPKGAAEMPILPTMQYLGKAARSRSIWLAGIAMFLVMGSTITFTSFLPNVLHNLRGITPVQAGFYGSLATLGTMFGSFLGPIICSRMGVMKRFLVITSLTGAVVTFWSWQLPMGPVFVVALFMAGFLQCAMSPTFFSLPVLLPEIGSVYAGSAGGIIATIQSLGAVMVPTFIITPLAGPSVTILFGLAALSCALITVPVLFLPELGTRALAAKAADASARSAGQVN